jgi:hypothetical protein
LPSAEPVKKGKPHPGSRRSCPRRNPDDWYQPPDLK